MMNCGYDPDPSLHYDLPPIAPQLWHAYHIAGEQLAVGAVAALLHRLRTGEGQDVSCAVHEAVSKNTELDLMSWVMRRAPLSSPDMPTRDGAAEPHAECRAHQGWALVHLVGRRRARRGQARAVPRPLQYARRPGAARERRRSRGPATCPDRPGATSARPTFSKSSSDSFAHFGTTTMPWREAQETGLLWAPLRKPHESALDEHWLQRHSFADVDHPELGRSLRYCTSKWLSTATSWQVGRRAPTLGEHTEAVLAEPPRARKAPAAPREAAARAAVAAWQALSAAERAHPRFLLVPRFRRRHALSRRHGRREPEGRVEGKPRHPPRRHGADRRHGRRGASPRLLCPA